MFGFFPATQARASNNVERASPIPATRVLTGACAITLVSTKTRTGFLPWTTPSSNTQRNTTVISIDTLAHNYRIIDDIVAAAAAAHWKLLSREKWYYILYNAIIHQETLCKDIAVI